MTYKQHKKKIEEFLEKEELFTIPKFARFIGCNYNTSHRYITNLLAEGKIKLSNASDKNRFFVPVKLSEEEHKLFNAKPIQEA